MPNAPVLPGVLFTVHTDRFYEAYIRRQHAEIKRQGELERRRIPQTIDYATFPSLRAEARHALARFRPETLGQAGRLEGITPADLTLLAVLIKRHAEQSRALGATASERSESAVVQGGGVPGATAWLLGG